MAYIFSSPPFYTSNIQLSGTVNPPQEITSNPKLWPFFRGCLGALDGTHIPCAPPKAMQVAYCNRKGFLSMNCLFACSFDMLFVYSLTGWEGSANDARIWGDALQRGFIVPEGFYYLGDAGYPHCKEILIPYRGVRYHLQERGPHSQR